MKNSTEKLVRDSQSPSSPKELFIAFTILSLQGFGGVIAVVQRELVEKRRWMTNSEFVQEWAIAQIIPGPNVVNLSIILGAKYFGFRGALAAVAGMLCIPLCVVLGLFSVYTSFSNLPGVSGALDGMGAVSAGLIAGTAIKLIKSLRHNSMGFYSAIAILLTCFFASVFLRIPLLITLIAFGLIGFLMCTLRSR